MGGLVCVSLGFAFLGGFLGFVLGFLVSIFLWCCFSFVWVFGGGVF